MAASSTTEEAAPDLVGRIRSQRDTAAASYPRLWGQVTRAWSDECPGDRAWLVYAANYLLQTAGVRWAIDPLTLSARVPCTEKVDTRTDLEPLSFVLLTHAHADHLDLELIRSLRHHTIRWVVPEPLLALVCGQAGLARGRVIVPREMETLHFGAVRITPFAGLHWELPVEGQGKPRHGVLATGYLVEFAEKRWLFPGDTRNYDASRLPDFGPLDGVFGHVWLGRGCALENEPPLLDEYCRFFRDLRPGRLVLAHLHEYGREADDFWHEGHAQQVVARWAEIAPGIPIEIARMGAQVEL